MNTKIKSLICLLFIISSIIIYSQNKSPESDSLLIQTDSLVYTNTIVITGEPPKVWISLINISGSDILFHTCSDYLTFGIERLINNNWQLVWDNFSCIEGFRTIPSQTTYRELTLPLIIDTLRYVFISSLDSTFEYVDTIRSNEFIIINGNVANVIDDDNKFYSYNLEQNYPNPFNPNTSITFTVPESQYVELKLYDVLGSEIKVLFKGYVLAGRTTIDLNAADLQSGIYFYNIKSDHYDQTKKLVLLK